MPELHNAEVTPPKQYRLLAFTASPMLDSVVRRLRDEDFVVSVESTLVGMRAALSSSPALMLIDVGLVGTDWTLLEEVRDRWTIPIVLLSCDRHGLDLVRGLELGADDFLISPFDEREMLARVRGLLRRVSLDRGGSATENSSATLAEFDGWTYCATSRRLVAPSGDPVPLTTREHALMSALVSNAGEPLSREFLMSAVAGVTWQAVDRRIDVLVSRLRKKLDRNGRRGSTLIDTVRCTGYIFVSSVSYRSEQQTSSEPSYSDSASSYPSMGRSGRSPVMVAASANRD